MTGEEGESGDMKVGVYAKHRGFQKHQVRRIAFEPQISRVVKN